VIADAGVGQGADAADVEQQEGDVRGLRERRRLGCERGVEDRQHDQDHPQRDEPGPRLPAAVEQDGDERRQERREDHAARIDEPAEKVVQRDRSDEDDQCLLKAEPLEVARDQEDDHAGDGEDLIDDRHQRGERHAEVVEGHRQRRADRRLGEDDDQEEPFLAERFLVIARRRDERHQTRPQAFKTARPVVVNRQRRVH
jgi:hypothetical protein